MDGFDFKQLEVLLNLPWYVYLITFFVVMIIFGKKKDWEYEAKLFKPGENTIIGEIEIKKYAKEDPIGEIELDFIKELYNKEFELVLNGDVIQRLQLNAEGTHCKILYPRYEKKTEIYRSSGQRRFNGMNLYFDDRVKPQNNQTFEVRVQNDVLATGQMIAD